MNNVQEINFAYKVRHALNESLDTLPASAAERLASARKIALLRKKKDSPMSVLAARAVLAGQANLMIRPMSWVGRVGLAVPVFVLVAGLIGIFQYEQQQHINEAAELDVAMLTDDLPLAAYADHGFNAYLEKRAE